MSFLLWLGLFCGLDVGRAYEVDYLYTLADAAYRSGKYETALELYEEVHGLAPSYRSAFNLAVSAEQAGQPALAFAFLETYLSSGQDPDTLRAALAEELQAMLARSLAILEVTTKPPGARIYVDRREVGSYGESPSSFGLEVPGTHTIEAVLEGHRSVQAVVEARLGEVRRIDLQLAPLTGEIVVDVVARAPAAIELLGPGDLELRARPGEPTTVPIGRYRIRVNAPEHLPFETEVEVRAGQRERRRAQLAPLPPPKGRLLVSAGSVRAEVIIGGAHRGQAPAVLELEAGIHLLEVRHEGNVLWAGDVIIEEGESVVRFVGEDGFSANAARALKGSGSPSGSYRGW